MKLFDQTTAVCQIFTFKEGILSTLAFDLRISVTSFVVELGDDDTVIEARFDAASLHVDFALSDGIEKRDLLNGEQTRDRPEHP
jgi:hypothetical protein